MRIIRHKGAWDTATAEKLAVWSNGFGVGDLRTCSEALYRTGNGSHFIHGQGGPMTRWARSVGDGTRGGEGVLICGADCETAEEWAEARLAAAEYERIFGPVEAG